jgi:hypothetical protein
MIQIHLIPMLELIEFELKNKLVCAFFFSVKIKKKVY